jgi:hypothetical protein
MQLKEEDKEDVTMMRMWTCLVSQTKCSIAIGCHRRLSVPSIHFEEFVVFVESAFSDEPLKTYNNVFIFGQLICSTNHLPVPPRKIRKQISCAISA